MNKEIWRRRPKKHRDWEDEKPHVAHGVERYTPKKLSFSECIHSYKAYTAFLALLAYFIYFAFRIKYVYDAEFSSVSHQVVAYFYLLVEISLPGKFTFLFDVRHNIDRILHIAAHNQRPILSYAVNIADKHLPIVDVFITCCGEADSVILATTLAACRQNYPKGKYRVFVSDDSDSPSLRKAICNLYSEFDNLAYITRGKDHEADFKTGNLNFAVAFTLKMRAAPAGLIAQLDADAVPTANWLSTVVRYILSDGNIGMVTAQLSLTNVPASDPLYQLAQTPGAGALKAALGVCLSTGSGYIIRRSALASIGDFPHDISEDTSISFRLMAGGWCVRQAIEELQHGLFPDTLLGHIKQRSRWVTGNLDLFPTINHLRRTGSLTTRQLLVAYGIVATALYYVLLPIPLAILPLLLLSQLPLIPNSNLSTLLPLATALVLTDTLHNQLLSLGPGSSLQLLSRSRDAQPWMCPFYLKKYLDLRISQKSDYEVSGKKPHGTEDADFDITTYMWLPRLKRALTPSTNTKIIIGYTIYATILLVAVLRIWFSNFPDDVIGIGSLPHEKYTPFLQHLFCVQRLFWPGLLWLDPLRWALVPLYYGIWGDRAGTAGDPRELLHSIWTVVFAVVQCLWGVFLCQNLWESL